MDSSFPLVCIWDFIWTREGKRRNNKTTNTTSLLAISLSIMVGLWLSLNVLSFQTSLETWTTAAIIFGGWSLRSHCKFGNESERMEGLAINNIIACLSQRMTCYPSRLCLRLNLWSRGRSYIIFGLWIFIIMPSPTLSFHIY